MLAIKPAGLPSTTLVYHMYPKIFRSTAENSFEPHPKCIGIPGSRPAAFPRPPTPTGQPQACAPSRSFADWAAPDCGSALFGRTQTSRSRMSAFVLKDTADPACGFRCQVRLSPLGRQWPSAIQRQAPVPALSTVQAYCGIPFPKPSLAAGAGGQCSQTPAGLLSLGPRSERPAAKQRARSDRSPPSGGVSAKVRSIRLSSPSQRLAERRPRRPEAPAGSPRGTDRPRPG